jgi:hypothetical protein
MILERLQTVAAAHDPDYDYIASGAKLHWQQRQQHDQTAVDSIVDSTALCYNLYAQQFAAV